MLALLLYLLFTYLWGSIPFGLLLTTLFGGDLDLRAAGSGNIGATNVARLYGWRIGGASLVLDLLKGFLPVLGALWLWPGLAVPALVAVVAFVGHCWPIFLELKGGKGVATGAGGLLALAPLPTLLAAAVWGALLALTGRSSVAGLGSAASLVGLAAWLQPGVLWVAVLLALGVTARHVANIRRIVSGEEREIVRPVGIRRTTPPDPADVLRQDPAGGQASTAVWAEAEPDPLEVTEPDER